MKLSKVHIKDLEHKKIHHSIIDIKKASEATKIFHSVRMDNKSKAKPLEIHFQRFRHRKLITCGTMLNEGKK